MWSLSTQLKTISKFIFYNYNEPPLWKAQLKAFLGLGSVQYTKNWHRISVTVVRDMKYIQGFFSYCFETLAYLC